MIKEDYVSFEIAKLLKEKGFVGEREIGCRCGFYEQNKEYPNQINLVYDDLNNSELECNECLRFTHQMAMKWLRETHGIHIVIHPSGGVYYGKYCLSIYVQRVKNKDFHLTYQTHEDSYEKAVEEGIGYSLISLVK